MKLVAKKNIVDQMVEAYEEMARDNKAPDHYVLTEDEAIALYHSYLRTAFKTPDPGTIYSRLETLLAVHGALFMGIKVRVEGME